MKKEDINFEDAMAELEKISKELENNDLDLESAVSKFEKGMEISKRCNEILQNAEKRISILINEDGNIQEENFLEE